MSKHTPGPWSVACRTGFVNQIWIAPAICTVYGAGEELEANARLIAAAPELLEALDELMRPYGVAECGLVNASGLHGNAYLVAIQKARTAIAKANGEQP